MAKPIFGKTRMRGIWASPDNPHRDGTYVETIRRRGKMNAGVHYRITDGEGGFWMYPVESVEILPEADPLDTPGGIG